MKILGLVGSSRVLGNTELMVTAIANAAVALDDQVSVRLLRLTDLKLGYCTGCMACAEQEVSPCPLDDDMEFFMSECETADALILGAPAYTLLPPGPLKLIADRLILQLSRRQWLSPKPAITVGVAGLPGWSEVLVPLLNCMVLGQGFRVVDSFLALGSGPGEVLLNADNLEHARLSGERLYSALRGENMPMPVKPGCCPICGGDFFRITKAGIQCPLCLAQGTLEDGVPQFEPEPANRWQPEAMRRHYTEWIQGSLDRYIERRPDVRQRLRPFRNREFAFVKPTREELQSPEPLPG